MNSRPTIILAEQLGLEGNSLGALTPAERELIAAQERLRLLKQREAAVRQQSPLEMDMAQRTGMELPREVQEREVAAAQLRAKAARLQSSNPLLANMLQRKAAAEQFSVDAARTTQRILDGSILR